MSIGPLTGTAAAADVPPTNLLPPAVSPTNAFVGETLMLTHGNWSDVSGGYMDQWQRCDSTMTCTAISGAVNISYQITYADVGDTLRVTEIAMAADGTQSSSTPSNQTSTVPGPPTPGMPPAIASSPAPRVNNTLTAARGTWTNADPGSITDTWEDCDGAVCNPIAGTTTTTPTTSYTLTRNDIGQTIEVMETATNGGTPANSPVFSQPTGLVTDPLPVADSNAPPTISGAAQQGQTLTASPGGWANNPTSYSYQWQDCDSAGQGCTAISGATRSTYTLTAADVADTIVVSVSGVNAAGTAPAATSAPTNIVQTSSTVSFTAAPGSAVTNQAVTLAATVTSSAAAGVPSGSVAFTNAGKPISGCSAVPVAPSGQSATVLCQTSFAAGLAQLEATFLPDAGSVVLGSSSSGQTLNVARDTPTTALDATAEVEVNSTTTYTATVAPNLARNGPIQPAGDVEFLDGGQPIQGCTSQRLVGGGATCATKYSNTGSRSITARYLGDTNFVGSSSAAEPVRVTALPAKGMVTATMQWTFAFAPTYTRVLNMVINGVPTGASVQITCHGRGCPYAKRSTTIGKPKPCTGKAKRTHTCPIHGRISLKATFQPRHLRPGAQITIEIRRPRYVGKYYRFTMLPRKQPRVEIGCVAIGSSRPNVGC